MITLEILRSGPMALVQDLGRPGFAHIGVTRSGAADRRSHLLANRLVANPVQSATVEVTLGGFAARVHGGTLAVAVTGAQTQPTVDGMPFGTNSVHLLRDGQMIALGVPRAGIRNYLAVRGGVAAAPILGSRSFDTLSGIGPPPLRNGDLVEIGEPAAGFPRLDQAPLPVPAWARDPAAALTVVRGPRDDWFTDAGALVDQDWLVSERSDRVGVRLTGRPLGHRWPERQLPSEGATRGAIQVPPNGQPVVLGPDHPVTGGYPVIGVVADSDADVFAQLQAGQRVRLRWADSGITACSAPAW